MRVRNMTERSPIELIHEQATFIVNQYAWACGNEHEALEQAAGELAVSASWLRKFIKRYPTGLNYMAGHNISQLYKRLCGTIERNAGALEHETNEGTAALRKSLERAP